MTKLDVAAFVAPLMTTIAAFSIVVSPGPAMAAETQAVAIRTSDLNLADPSAQRVLDRRIDRAARRICGLDQVRTATRLPSESSKACYEQALRATRAQVAEVAQNARRGG
jgi:UrcA family protein